jgi:hypothetical protein
MAHGVVDRIDPERGEIECEIWLESVGGDRTTRGRAVVALPRRTRLGA